MLAPPSPSSDDRKGSSKSNKSSTTDGGNNNNVSTAGTEGSRASWKLPLSSRRKNKSLASEDQEAKRSPSRKTFKRSRSTVKPSVRVSSSPSAAGERREGQEDVERGLAADAAAPSDKNLSVPNRGKEAKKPSLSPKPSFNRSIRSAVTPMLGRRSQLLRGGSGGGGSGSEPTPPSSGDLPSPSTPKTHTVEFKLVEDLRLVTIPVSSCLLVLLFYILLGTVTFSAWEGWNYLDGVYFCFTSLGRTGMVL